MPTLAVLAGLLNEKNTLETNIAHLIGMPAEKGHVGEFIASQVFDIELAETATQAGFDGHFRIGPMSGRTVNVKWYGKREGILDINPKHLPDYYLVLTGPRSNATSSRGTTRPWLIEEVFLFEARPLVGRLSERGIQVGVATSVRGNEWEDARIWSHNAGPIGSLVSPSASKSLSMFASQ